jgi:ubiquinone/menaquinone biosynthesis C-methylase UbiE
MKDEDTIRNSVRKNYSKVAKNGSSGGCCNGGCRCGGSVNIKESSLKLGYSENDYLLAPGESNMGLGCGNPIAIAKLKEGETVLDLGCGGGFDCFLARNKVGEKGYVIGIDMTYDMVMLARKNVSKKGYTNIDFRLGEIEYLPVADESVDVIISNCVINLSPDKRQVFFEAYRVLKKGGRLSISDVVATKKLDDKTRKDLSLISSCIGGAEYVEGLRKIMQDAGFVNINLREKDNSQDIIFEWFEDTDYSDSVASFIIEADKHNYE